MNPGIAETELRRSPRVQSGIATIGDAIQWVTAIFRKQDLLRSFADGEAAIVYAELSGIPFSTITEAAQIIDPTTANNRHQRVCLTSRQFRRLAALYQRKPFGHLPSCTLYYYRYS
jgi:hypothetical protein